MEIGNETMKNSHKAEGKLLKRKRIEEAGGVRPRSNGPPSSAYANQEEKKSVQSVSRPHRQSNSKNKKENKNSERKSARPQSNRFGRVMERVPCPNRPRISTLSIAIPGSVLSNSPTKELRTQIVGQIARAAAMYHVDEIIVFDDKLAKDMKGGYYHSQNHRRPRNFIQQNIIGNMRF